MPFWFLGKENDRTFAAANYLKSFCDRSSVNPFQLLPFYGDDNDDDNGDDDDDNDGDDDDDAGVEGRVGSLSHQLILSLLLLLLLLLSVNIHNIMLLLSFDFIHKYAAAAAAAFYCF